MPLPHNSGMDKTHDLLTTKEAAQLVRRSPETLIRWILHDGLAAVRVKTKNGHRYLISRAALLARLEQVRPEVPVRIIDPRTAEGLKRFGLACPTGTPGTARSLASRTTE